MEHRDADFNILLATDSYKVQYKYGLRGNERGPTVAGNERSQGGFSSGFKAISLHWRDAGFSRPNG